MKLRHVLLVGLYLSSYIALYAGSSARAEETPGITRWAKGTLDYRVIATGESWGSEEWHITVYPDGSRTLQTRNRIDAFNATRHVTLRVEESFRPLELTAEYFVQGMWRGTGFFAIDGNQLKAVVKTPNGMIEQSRTVPEKFSFIPHPLATDAWGTWSYDMQQGGPQERVVYDMDSQAAAVSSMLGKVYAQTIEYMGEEDVTVPAGTFLSRHFRVNDTYNFYLTGPDDILVRFVGDGAEREFVLNSLETGQ